MGFVFMRLATFMAARIYLSRSSNALTPTSQHIQLLIVLRSFWVITSIADRLRDRCSTYWWRGNAHIERFFSKAIMRPL